jgi:hypothetical protein
MSLYQTAALLGLAVALAWLVLATIRGFDMDRRARSHDWWVPALGSVALLLWTVHCLTDAGFSALLPAITSGAWSNQIWFDLLLAICAALAFLIPEARRLNMHVWLWLMIVAASGSIGLLAMMARVCYLRFSAGAESTAESA